MNLFLILLFGCGPSINQAVKIDRISYDFHITTKIDDIYDRTLLNIKWVDVDLALALEKIRAEQYLRMVEDRQNEVRYLRELPSTIR